MEIHDSTDLSGYSESLRNLLAVFSFCRSKTLFPEKLLQNEIQYLKNLLNAGQVIITGYDSLAVSSTFDNLSLADINTISVLKLSGIPTLTGFKKQFEFHQVLEDYLNWLTNLQTKAVVADAAKKFGPLKLPNGDKHPALDVINEHLKQWAKGRLFDATVIWNESNKERSLLLFIEEIKSFITRPEKLTTNSRWDYMFGKEFFKINDNKHPDGRIPNFYDATKENKNEYENLSEFKKQLKKLQDDLQSIKI